MLSLSNDNDLYYDDSNDVYDGYDVDGKPIKLIKYKIIKKNDDESS